jgi:hypothetical protein
VWRQGRWNDPTIRSVVESPPIGGAEEQDSPSCYPNEQFAPPRVTNSAADRRIPGTLALHYYTE